MDVVPIWTRRLAPLAIIAGVLLAACDGGQGAGSAPSDSPSLQPTSPSLPSPGTAAGTPSPSLPPATLTDDDGVTLTIEEPPDRIVTWAPSNTEILFALGLGDQVVGVSGPFDDYPSEATDIEQVAGAGGVEPNVEVVVGLEPDLVLNGFLGGDEWKARLREAGVDVFSVYAADFDDALHDIETVGLLTSTEFRAEAIVDSMRSEAEEVRTAVAEEDRVTCFFEVGYPDLYTVGPGDFPFDLLQIAGCDPITSSADGPYPLWSVEQLVEDDPDVYILTTEAGVSPDEVAKRPGFEALSAVKSGRIVLVDSDLITRPGPRLLEGLQALAEGLHPEVVG